MNPHLRPETTSASRPLTFDVEAINERGEMVPTAIAGEHALTLYIDKLEVVTLMTMGQAPEALAVGYLRNQRLLHGVEEIAAVQVDWETGSAAVSTRSSPGFAARNLRDKMKKRTITSGCGQGTMFGSLMEEMDRVQLREDVVLHEETLYALLGQIRRHETQYKIAGAVHGCALATNDAGKSRILSFVEDVGRHNAVDTIAGQMWLQDIDGADKIFYTTGRLTSEMVIKAAQMRIPFLVSRSGLTQMGYEIAAKTGITMIGRATGQHYLLFTGKHRFRKSAAPTMVA